MISHYKAEKGFRKGMNRILRGFGALPARIRALPRAGFRLLRPLPRGKKPPFPARGKGGFSSSPLWSDGGFFFFGLLRMLFERILHVQAVMPLSHRRELIEPVSLPHVGNFFFAGRICALMHDQRARRRALASSSSKRARRMTQPGTSVCMRSADALSAVCANVSGSS